MRSVAVQLFCMVCFLQAVRCEAVRSVIGYINESVVLRSEADPSWALERIRWSIYQNTTYIATLINDEIRVDRFHRFLGRLELNAKSGDLTIKNVKAGDSLEYKVDFREQQGKETSKRVTLNVREPFSGPNITLLHSVLDKYPCVVLLQCSSPSSNISLMWKPEPGLSEHFGSDSSVTRQSVMWTSFRNRDVTFSCIATDNIRNKKSHLSVKCTAQDPCKSLQIWLVLTILLLVAAIILIIRMKMKGQNRPACTALLDRCPTINVCL